MHRNVFTYIREHIQTGYRCHYVPLLNMRPSPIRHSRPACWDDNS